MSKGLRTEGKGKEGMRDEGRGMSKRQESIQESIAYFFCKRQDFI
jgi:hypothetical protein